MVIALLIALLQEDEYYPITKIPLPPEAYLEGGGIERMPDGALMVASRRGEIWRIDAAGKAARWAHGLHEVLGLAERGGWLYAVQRGEVTRIKDSDGDGKADVFQTVCDKWEISGDYHEYAFGSKFDKNGHLWVVLCLTGSFTSNVPFRGWAVRVTEDGEMIPTCSGIRSPGGIGIGVDGEVFYCDNQGPWNGTSSLKHLKVGSFQVLAPGLTPVPVGLGVFKR